GDGGQHQFALRDLHGDLPLPRIDENGERKHAGHAKSAEKQQCNDETNECRHGGPAERVASIADFSALLRTRGRGRLTQALTARLLSLPPLAAPRHFLPIREKAARWRRMRALSALRHIAFGDALG